MRVCVWRTGHVIADTVAEAIAAGLVDNGNTRYVSYATTDRIDLVPLADIHIGYGILRGMDKVFSACDEAGKPWFNIDKGYLGAKHFSGYYRISLRGTQHTRGGNYADHERLGRLGISFRHWRGLNHEYPVLICPPTDYVCEWLPEAKDWLRNAIRSLKGKPYVVRYKDASRKTDLEHEIRTSNYVLTFNSSVGWEALRLGVPCVSDVNHSMVGSYFGHMSLDKLNVAQDIVRQELLASMAGLQLSMDEIKQGKLWPLMSRLLSTLASTAEKQ